AQRRRRHLLEELHRALSPEEVFYCHSGSSSCSSREGINNVLPVSNPKPCLELEEEDGMMACNSTEDDSSANTASQNSANLVYDDSQVNEHPIPRDSLRTIKLNKNSSRSLQLQDSLARSSYASLKSLGSRMLHGMKKTILEPADRVYRGTMNPFWVTYEVVTCLLLLSGLGLMLYYAFSLQPEEAPTDRR
ncbi:hypothetical protein DUNSADRAFT_11568, partial [Dunaliella salina]